MKMFLIDFVKVPKKGCKRIIDQLWKFMMRKRL